MSHHAHVKTPSTVHLARSQLLFADSLLDNSVPMASHNPPAVPTSPNQPISLSNTSFASPISLLLTIASATTHNPHIAPPIPLADSLCHIHTPHIIIQPLLQISL